MPEVTPNQALPDETIRLAFQLLLGREAESEKAVGTFRKFQTVAQLRQAFVTSDEFKKGLLPVILPLLGGVLGRMRNETKKVDIEVSAEQFETLFARLREQWTKLGETEPHWSVLSNPKFKADIFAQNEAEFYKSGHAETGRIINTLKRLGLEVNPAGTALELGCGTGRVTHALADMFAKVIGVDVSPGNLRLCEEKLRAFNKTNVVCRLLRSPEDVGSIPPIDFFYSFIVLQHNPPPIIHYFLSRILSKIKPGGVAFFQVPTHTPGYTFDVGEFLGAFAESQKSGQPLPTKFDMHAIPMSAVFALFAEHGLTPVEVLMDTATGNFGSHTFLAVRK